MNTYQATFYGRLNGAIGRTYLIATECKGNNEDEATIDLYRSYEHISSLKLTKKQDIEFKVGDWVTFKPYEKAIPCKVSEVLTNAKHLDGSDDERIFYVLSGGAISKTSGLCIVESKYYKDNKQ